MSLIVWNYRGLANPRTVRLLKELNKCYRPGIIFLSETLVKKNKVEKVKKQLDFVGCHAVDAVGHGGGLALLWKNEGGITIVNSCSNFIDFEVTHEQVGSWRYTGYYGFPERSRRRESWDMLRKLSTYSMLPWCIIGDFNDLMTEDEKQGKHGHQRALLNGFSEIITDCNLFDLGFTGNKFTWERGRGTDKWVLERLDRGLETTWSNLFPQAEIKVHEVST